MRKNKTQNIKELIEGSHLAQIMQKGLFLNNLNQQLQSRFPPQFKGLYRLANMHEDSLNIEVASAVVRQGFLFRQQELLRLIQQDYPEITRLNFKINPQLLNKN
ncbi:DciA family protein [Pasteurellaceae bacterium LIM206]|nr:DciA family protein [Pasteurellaceae bacterium LIM206]